MMHAFDGMWCGTCVSSGDVGLVHGVLHVRGVVGRLALQAHSVVKGRCGLHHACTDLDGSRRCVLEAVARHGTTWVGPCQHGTGLQRRCLPARAELEAWHVAWCGRCHDDEKAMNGGGLEVND